jgi:ADP-dependent NAD(P)H-hydrate dehydratase / NAD(P)H-hydrate epimerase
MGVVDQRTASEFGVPLWFLMENAGSAVAHFCMHRYPVAKRVVVLCGRGNNGGDGLVVARVLAAAGLGVKVILLGRASELRGDAAGALERMRSHADTTGLAQIEVIELVDEAEVSSHAFAEAWENAQLFIDAVVGTGFTPPLRGLALALRGGLAENDVPVVAVDLPSGWDADSLEQTAKGAFRADAVVTFTRPKLAHVFGHLTGTTFGPVVVAEIGSPAEAVHLSGQYPARIDPVHPDETGMNGVQGLKWAGAAKAVAEAPRGVNANKGKYGHVLVVGGSYGTAGAPSMASLAALRTGAGLVTAAVPRAIVGLVGMAAPELMVRAVAQGVGNRDQGSEDNSRFSVGQLEEGQLAALLKGIQVVAIGPGLGQEGSTPEFVRRFVKKVNLPMVIDADALNAFAGKAELLKADGRVMVLTPHPGEMARLTGLTIKQVETDRIGLARRFAIEHKLTLVLKGWRTLIAHPDGSIAVNTSGNPAMAKGGSGDILTGVVAAMLAQFAGSGNADDVARAVEAAVYLHGLAGDFAANAMDEHTVLATDTVAHLSDAFRYRAKDADGLTWICGLNRAKA